MILPEFDEIKWKNTMHGSGRNGAYMYRYEDVGGLGLACVVRRKDRRSRELTEFSFDWLPDATFTDYPSLRDAVSKLTDAQIALEKAKYPRLREQPKGHAPPYRNRCRLCSGLLDRLNGEYSIVLAESPDGMRDWHFDLCGQHLSLVDDPRALLKALQDEVERRRQRRAQARRDWDLT